MSNEYVKTVSHDEAMRMIENAKRAKEQTVSTSELRKMQPVGTLVKSYFPDALLAVSAVAWVGNEKHNPGESMHWARGKSDDHDDCDIRHFIDSGREKGEWDVTTLPDGRAYAVLHAAQHAWRALAALQLAVEANGGQVIKVLNNSPTHAQALVPGDFKNEEFYPYGPTDKRAGQYRGARLGLPSVMPRGGNSVLDHATDNAKK